VVILVPLAVGVLRLGLLESLVVEFARLLHHRLVRGSPLLGLLLLGRGARVEQGRLPPAGFASSAPSGGAPSFGLGDVMDSARPVRRQQRLSSQVG